MSTESLLIPYLTTGIYFFLAYLLSVGIAGGFKAWVCKKMGDDTAELEGMLTPDPLVHVDLLGLMSLVLLGFGWGKRVPVDYYNFRPPYLALRRAVAYFADVFMHLILAIVSIVVAGFVNYVVGACSLPMQTAYLKVGYTFVYVFFSANIFLAVVCIISNCVILFIHKLWNDSFVQEGSLDETVIYYIALIGPLLLFYVYGTYLQQICQFLVFMVCKFFGLLG